MLETSGLSTNFLKKESFSGSHLGMRYTFKKNDEGIVVYVYAEPWSFDASLKENRISKEFDFSEKCIADAVLWLEDIYTKNRRFFESADKNKMGNMLSGTHLGLENLRVDVD